MQANPLKTKETSERIQALVEAGLKRKGMSGRKASMQIVGHDGLIRDIRAGRLPSIDKLEILFDLLDLELYFGPPRDTGAVPQIVLDGTEFAQVPVHGAALAAGNGIENASEERIGHMAFRRSWLKRIGVAASAAVLARADGESMAPTIHHGDMLLIDRARAEPPKVPRAATDTRPAQIYAVLDDGAARVKRIELVPGGTLALLSDNPNFAPEFRPSAAVAIIGRVVWWGHTNKE